MTSSKKRKSTSDNHSRAHFRISPEICPPKKTRLVANKLSTKNQMVADIEQVPDEDYGHVQVLNGADGGSDRRGGNNRGEDETGNKWQTVESRQSKKRGADGEKTKYPEISSNNKQDTPIRIADLQNMVLYALADGIAPTWIAFKHSHYTRKVVVLMVPGLEKDMFDETVDFFGMVKEQLGAVTSSKNSSTTRAAPAGLESAKLHNCVRPIAEVFNQIWPVRAPGDSKYAKLHSPLQAMLIAKIPSPSKDKGFKGPRPPAEERTFKAIRTPITQFIHSSDELREAEYPIHPAAFTSQSDAGLESMRREGTNQSLSGGWVDTKVSSAVPVLPTAKPVDPISLNLNIYAIDCEMVLTNDDVYSLARISVLDFNGNTVLDKYVLPSLPIKNYFTQYSGITASHLENVNTTLSDIQSELLTLFTPSTILLGHSLESDLNALKMTHPFIIDTSLIYPHPRGPPLRSSLKFLAQKYLRREIQQNTGHGHDSCEDALAVLDLVKLKCEKGPKWGTTEAAGETIFKRLSRGRDRNGNNRTTAIVDHGTPERGYGKDADVAIGCSNDEEVVSGVIRAVNGDGDLDGKAVRGNGQEAFGKSDDDDDEKMVEPDGGKVKPGGVDFVWARLRRLESTRGWCNNNRGYGNLDELHTTGADVNKATTESAVLATDTTTSDLISAVAETAQHIQTIHGALPRGTLFVVYSGTGDPRDVGRLQKLQAQFRKEFKVKKWDELTVKWTDDEEQALRCAVERARDGCGFLCVK